MIHFPHNVVRVMRGQMEQTRRVVGVHFRGRHAHGPAGARSWIAEYRRLDRASGYSEALRMVENK